MSKFKYCDRVEVISGFYQGQTGRVDNYDSKWFKKKYGIFLINYKPSTVSITSPASLMSNYIEVFEKDLILYLDDNEKFNKKVQDKLKE